MRMGKLQKTHTGQSAYLPYEQRNRLKKIPDKKKYSDILMFMSAMFISNPKGK